MFLVFSLWLNFRPELGNLSIHTALFLIPIIVLVILPFGLISFRGMGKYIFLAGLFLAIVLLSALVNGDFRDSLFIKWSVSFFIMIFVASTIRNRQDIVLISKALVLAVGFMCLYGFITWTGTGNAVNPFNFATRNALSNWTTAVYPVVLVLSLFLSKKIVGKIFWGLVFIVIALGQFFTLNRSAWIIIFLSIFAVFLMFKNKKKIIIYFLILVLSFYIVGSQWLEFNEVVKRSQSLSSVENVISDNSVVDRYEQGKKTFIIFSRYPLLGIGLGNYIYYDTGINIRYPNEESHSVYFNVLAETGILGLSSIALIIILLFSSLWHAYKESTNDEDRYIAMMLMISIAMILIRGTTTHEIQFIPITPLVIGLAIRFSIIANPSRIQEKN